MFNGQQITSYHNHKNAERNSVSLLNFGLYMVLIHFSDKLVDLIFTVSMVTPLNKVCGDLTETTLGGAQLERPQEVVSLLKVLPSSVDFVNEILYTDDTMLSQLLLNDRVVCDCNTLFVHFAVATLVHQLTHTLQIWVSTKKILKISL